MAAQDRSGEHAPLGGAAGYESLGIAPDEGEHSGPGVLGCLRVLLLAAVEEAVRSALVGHELVLDARGPKRLLEGGVVVGRDVLVGSCLQCQDRCLDLS